MFFKVDKMYRLPDAGALKAFVDVVVDDVLVIKGIRVVQGKGGLNVSPPQEQGKDNKWYDQVIFRSAEVYSAFCAAVITHYGEQEKQDKKESSHDYAENLV